VGVKDRGFLGDLRMPIYGLLHNAAFEPSEVEALAEAFEIICGHLNVTLNNDPLRDLVARKVIDLAERGTRDPQDICVLVLADIHGVEEHIRGGSVVLESSPATLD
jgi:hypothetical protein